MGRFLDLSGEKFGRLTVLSPTNERRNSSVVWLCKCECGNETLGSAKELKTGMKRSCGCLQKEARSLAGKQTTNIRPKKIGEQNRKVRTDSESGVKNISKVFLKSGAVRYRPYLENGKRKQYLGSFVRLEDAVEALDTALEAQK